MELDMGMKAQKTNIAIPHELLPADDNLEINMVILYLQYRTKGSGHLDLECRMAGQCDKALCHPTAGEVVLHFTDVEEEVIHPEEAIHPEEVTSQEEDMAVVARKACAGPRLQGGTAMREEAWGLWDLEWLALERWDADSKGHHHQDMTIAITEDRRRVESHHRVQGESPHLRRCSQGLAQPLARHLLVKQLKWMRERALPLLDRTLV